MITTDQDYSGDNVPSGIVSIVLSIAEKIDNTSDLSLSAIFPKVHRILMR
jgi:glycyl-tRNA synthetase beta subunit